MLRNPPDSVRIFEVGPRDGLQNEKQPVSTEDKFTFIQKLVEAGLTHIELTSFVRPDAIPQLSDAKALTDKVNAASFHDALQFSCLVPNMKGMEAAHAQGVKEVAVFIATSDSFSQRNINCTVEESYGRIKPVIDFALQHNIRVRGYLSTVFGCPYEGDIAPQKVLDGVQHLLDMGVYEVSLGDTIGIGHPLQVQEVLHQLLQHVPREKLAMHFHDTRGLALANILISLEAGITAFDSSAGGLGGCPYAKGASGNVATEDVVYLMESMGIKTGVNLEKLVEASSFMLRTIGRESPSKIHRVLSAK